MASNANTGAYAVYISQSTLKAKEIKALLTGKLPSSSSTATSTSGGRKWERLYTAADTACTVTRSGETLNLITQEEGVVKNVIIGPDVWTINVPIADINIDVFQKYYQLDPTATSSATGKRIKGDYTGTDLLAKGYPMVLVRKSYANASTAGFNVVPITDPQTFVFVQAGLNDRSMEVNFDPNSQQIFSIPFVAKELSSTSDAKILLWQGTITRAS